MWNMRVQFDTNLGNDVLAPVRQTRSLTRLLTIGGENSIVRGAQCVWWWCYECTSCAMPYGSDTAINDMHDGEGCRSTPVSH